LPTQPPTNAAAITQAADVLKGYFGFDGFRPHQGFLIEQVLSGRDVLGVMPTGAGKSLIYQVPALVMAGMTMVLSPLISLMKDQVDALRQAGVTAALLNSTQSPEESEQVYAEVRRGQVKLLYVTPERLGNQRFVDLCCQLDIPLVAVDEAHCVSQWGNDFRPSYAAIADFIGRLGRRPAVCALTATATSEVRADIADKLRLQDPQVLVAGFDRQNLYLAVVRPKPADKLATLLSEVRRRQGQFGIVYCSTRQAVLDVYGLLVSHGISATFYHGGLSDDERRRSQDDFIFDRCQVMVATNAFGMGIDKSNVGYVIHFNMPRDLESYYQEAGRAGRDGSPADCLLIYNAKDVQTVRYFAVQAHEARLSEGVDEAYSEALQARDRERVRQMAAYCKTNDCLRSFILRYFGESDTPYRCEHCASCDAESQLLDLTAEAHRALSCVQELSQRDRPLGRVMVANILRGSSSKQVLEQRYDRLAAYGTLSGLSSALAHAMLDALVEAGYLRVADGQYPTLSCTPQGAAFLDHGDKFEVKVAVSKTVAVADAPAGGGGAPGSGAAPTAVGWGGGQSAAAGADIDQGLLERLKALRREIAQRQAMPAYIIFHDSTLLDMCAKQPRTIDEFLLVSGVGQKKAELYGEAFLACLAEG
jgi:ATP-dependent DNA helicase RecQ